VPKVLSQDEIDALLNNVSSDEQSEEKLPVSEENLRSIVTYDFKHPNRVSKDQIRTLENLHDNLAGHLGSTLSAIQRAMVDIDLVSVDQITYAEFVMSLSSPSNTFTVNMDPLEGRFIVDFSPALAFLFVDRMFGGSGRLLETERELTGIERTVLAKIVKNLYRELERSWTTIIKTEMKTSSFESNPQFMQIIAPGETVLVVSFQIKMLGNSGLLTICYPYMTLEPVMEDLTGRHWMDKKQGSDSEPDHEVTSGNLQEVKAEIMALLGTTELTMRDFVKLKAGDVIALDQLVNTPLEIYVQGEKKFTAHPGIVGKRKGFQVEDYCD
jgi:flagellar motor switch protein FliM